MPTVTPALSEVSNDYAQVFLCLNEERLSLDFGAKGPKIALPLGAQWGRIDEGLPEVRGTIGQGA